MKKLLHYSLVALLAMVMGKLSAQEVTLDFTLTDADNSKVSLWGFPASSKNKTVEELSFTYGDYTVKVAGSEGEGYYWHDKDHYLLFGKEGATLTLPAFSFDVERIEIEGNSGASDGVLQNIFVGETAVSTETKGAKGTNIFEIAADYQGAGNIYVIRVNSKHNNQIKTIKIWKKGTSQEVTIPEADNIAAFTALGSGAEAVLKLDGARVTYVSSDGKSVYVRDATGGMCFYNQSAFAGASNTWVLGGSVTGKVNMRNNMTQMNITDGAALTHTEGAAYEPVAVTMSELVNHVADLVTLTEDFTATDISGKIYNNENKDVQLYDNFKLGYTVNGGDVLQNLTGVVILYNEQVEIAPTLAPTIAEGEQSEGLLLTLKGTVGEEVSLTFGAYNSEDNYSVDFGDGQLLTQKVGVNNAGPVKEDGNTGSATVFTGTVAGDGTIKVYGKNDIWYFLSSGGAMPTSFEQDKLMNVVQMSISGANAKTVELPAYEKMTQFSFTNSPVRAVDVSKVTSLKSLSIFNTTQCQFDPQLEDIDVSQNVNLETIILGGNTYKKGKLTALDFTNNTKLTQISAENNMIASVRGIAPTVKNIYLSNNELESITLPEFTVKGTIQIQNNKFTLATLPTKPAITSANKYTYAPQPAYEVAESLEELDLSSQLTTVGVLTEAATTTYSFVTADGTALVEGTDYEMTEPGKFKFLKEQTEKVHGVMATDAFPKFTGNNAYVTTEFEVKLVSTPSVLLTLKGTVGEEISLTFGAYDAEDTYSVDFGDGQLQTAQVGIENKGPVQEDGTTPVATTFKGTVAGDGTIKVYGKNDIWYFLSSGDAMPTGFDQAKLMNVVQMSISGANVESVELPAYEKMTQFSFTNSPVKTVDVSKVSTLKSLSVFNTTQSAFEPQLETIDVSKNFELETIILGGNTYKKGKLTALDFTNNTNLTQISAENNKIASVTGIAATVKNIYLSNNELASITLPEFTVKGTIQIQNNKFTLATLPTKPAITSANKYTYAPQPAYEVAESLEELDLSSQLTTTGVLEAPSTTTYSFVTAGGTALVEGTDYQVTAPGKFKFLKQQTEKVHGVMATDAFPKFTGNNAYVTTEFAIPATVGIQTVGVTATGKVYNLQGMEVKQPSKGLYIQGNKKVLVK